MYHGTTSRRARRICAEGFQPKKPSRRVWFAASRSYAKGRAKCQARRTHDRPVVLTCDLDVPKLARELGSRRIMNKGAIIAIDGHVPVTVLRSYPAAPDVPSSPDELAAWVNHLLRLKPHNGVSRRHPGIDRLSRWVASSLGARPSGRIRPTEILGMARRWLPEYFDRYEIDPDSLHASRKPEFIKVDVAVDWEACDGPRSPQEDEALDCLADPKARRRIRGLALLERLEEPDLFDWCAMLLEDESVQVRVAALHTMRRCRDGSVEGLEPLVGSPDARIRGAAIAAIAHHAGEDAPRWIEYGLKDHSRCVRTETAALLSRLNPGEHRRVFELALYDPNPEIRRRAERLAGGRSYCKVAHRTD